MKKVKLLLLGLLPLLSYSQTYSELMWIVGENDFKRVMIENDFQFDTILDGTIIYGYNLVKDSKEGSKSLVWGGYNKNGVWKLQFADKKTLIYRFGQYEEIVDSIKEKCDYVDVIGVDGIDYVVYRCIESRFEGDIGFVIYDGSGLIRYFPKE
jgi:hypothetical protein